ncbi:transcriptional regulator [Intrasporangium oryzae NRRL B-24470]|uniref:Transcriptional regulator n=1 Tax=Intrasporangium oryzae NRRL B-24470 TaxID=1386089 RepID=W9G5Z4_9MICO|nr:LCP family protein [Intrasporangium oryzae]EWT01450.1 transcriptional regulator [Intrasporangium oryzae NRRL B-24470]
MSRPHDRRPTVEASSGGRRSIRRDLRAGFRRALGLTILGTAIPGAGLTRTRSRKTGWLLLLLFLGSVAGLAWYVYSRGISTGALSLLTNQDVLRVAPVSLGVLGFVWCASIVATAVQARPPSLDRARTRTLGAVTTVLVLLVAGTSYKGVEYALITKDTVTEVFGSAPPPEPGRAAEVVAGEDPWAETPRVNILFLGSDAGVGRDGTRTDSMIVASIDTKTGNTALISLPRNLQNVPLPKDSPLRKLYPSGVYGSPVCFRQQVDPNDPCMLNAIWTEVDDYRRNHPGSFSGVAPGREQTRAVIQEVTGLKIDHLVVIDLKGFEQLINAMGGVDVNVKLSGYGTKLPIGGHSDGHGGVIGEKGYFSPGLQHLSGNLALWYARTRAADDDFYRQARQRCVVQAVIKQVNPAAMIGKYPELARIARENIYTDIPAENLGAFAELIDRVQKATITSVALTPKQGIDPGNPSYRLIRSMIQKAIEPPAATPSASATPGATASASPKPTPSRSSGTVSADKSYEQC